jgi:hypothetical protein
LDVSATSEDCAGERELMELGSGYWTFKVDRSGERLKAMKGIAGDDVGD